MYVLTAESNEQECPDVPKQSQKRESLQTIVSVDTEHRITGIRVLPHLDGNVSVDRTAQQKIHSNFTFMEVAHIELSNLNPKFEFN